MASWLEKMKTSVVGQKKSAVPAVQKKSLPTKASSAPAQAPKTLPNATIVYGIGASLLFALSYSMMVGHFWLPGLTVFALGICFAGFALHLLKHQD